MSKMRITIIPTYMIETTEGRQLYPAWVIERSVFYLYGIDWEYLWYPDEVWWRHYWLNRN